LIAAKGIKAGLTKYWVVVLNSIIIATITTTTTTTFIEAGFGN